MSNVTQFPNKHIPQHTVWCDEFASQFNRLKADAVTSSLAIYRSLIDASQMAMAVDPEVLFDIEPIMPLINAFIKLSSPVIADVLTACRWFDQPFRWSNFYVGITENHPLFVFTLGEGVYFRAQYCTFDTVPSDEAVTKASLRFESSRRIIIKQKFDPDDQPTNANRFAIPLLQKAERLFFESACAAQFGYDVIPEDGGCRIVYTKLAPDHKSCVRYSLTIDTHVFDVHMIETTDR